MGDYHTETRPHFRLKERYGIGTSRWHDQKTAKETEVDDIESESVEEIRIVHKRPEPRNVNERGEDFKRRMSFVHRMRELKNFRNELRLEELLR